MPSAQEKTLKNAKAFKVISTSVSPEMHKALRAQVTEEYTMSHLLRDLIQQSHLMRGGPQSQQFSLDLEKSVVSLKEEIAQLRKDMQALSLAAVASTEPDPAQKFQATEESAKTIETVLQSPIRSVHESPDYYFDDLDEFDASKDPDWAWCQNIIQQVAEEDGILESSDQKAREKSEYMSAETEDEPQEEMQKEPAQEKVRARNTLFGRLTAMLGVARKTA
jgi:hypothetical protein